MNVRRGGLGRGLGALIPTGPGEERLAGARFDELPVDAIEPNPRQPREVFEEEALAELVASIRAVGVLQPVVVRELDAGRYQLVMGERRWRASREAGFDTIPAIIRDIADDSLLRDALLENLHRQQLNALEEAAAYQQLLEEFGTTHEELADRIGRSRSHVTNTLRLLHLAPAVQRRVAAGVLSAGHARALLAVDAMDEQERLAARVVAEGLSVRAVEELVATRTDATRARAPRRKPTIEPSLEVLAARLADLWETRVSIELGRRRGKVVVEFATMDDLDRIVAVMAPELGSPRRDGTPAPAGAPHGPDDSGGDHRDGAEGIDQHGDGGDGDDKGGYDADHTSNVEPGEVVEG